MSRRISDQVPSGSFSFLFNTNSAGSPVSIAASPALICYKDGATASGSTLGLTLTVDSSSITGLHKVAVDLTASTSFYSTGSTFSICFTAGTAGGTSLVGMEVAHFTIGRQTVPMLIGAGAVAPLGIIDSGTATAATSNSLTLRAANTLEADVVVGATVLITGGTTGLWQTGLVSDFDPATEIILLQNGWSGSITPTGTNTYILFATAPDPSSTIPTAAENATAVLAGVIEGSTTLKQSLMLANSVLGGKVSGLPLAPVFRDIADSKARVTATTDADGNRTAVTRDLT
jgi:hypothetical protein